MYEYNAVDYATCGEYLARQQLHMQHCCGWGSLLDPACGGTLVFTLYSVPCTGPLVLAEPADACSRLRNSGSLEGSVVMVDRGSCTFMEKVRMSASSACLATRGWCLLEFLYGTDSLQAIVHKHGFEAVRPGEF